MCMFHTTCRYSAYYDVKTKNNGADTIVIFVIVDRELYYNLSLIKESKDKIWFVRILTFYSVCALSTFFEIRTNRELFSFYRVFDRR